MRTLIYACILWALAALSAHAQDRGYSNERFRFSAHIPAGMTACPHIPPAPDPGFIVPLSGQGCDRPLGGAYLAITGEYNMPDFSTTHQAARARCEGGQIRPTRVNTRLAFQRCERRPDQGWVMIEYIALRIAPNRYWALHGVIHTATLRCRPADCARHEPRLREAVASMRFR